MVPDCFWLYAGWARSQKFPEVQKAMGAVKGFIEQALNLSVDAKDVPCSAEGNVRRCPRASKSATQEFWHPKSLVGPWVSEKLSVD